MAKTTEVGYRLTKNEIISNYQFAINQHLNNKPSLSGWWLISLFFWVLIPFWIVAAILNASKKKKWSKKAKENSNFAITQCNMIKDSEERNICISTVSSLSRN